MAKKREQDDLLGIDFGGDADGDSGDSLFGAGERPAAEASLDDLFAAEMPPPQPAGPAPESYVVLARRYRPQTFGEIVGQEGVRGAIEQAIRTGQIGHAYLFSGPRGTGKTSTARILAKALNCQNGGPRPDPCGKCASCVSITAGSSLDVIEIDAASNTGVDNIRDLRTGVVLAPFSRFKVYIVDEVHMLSTQAFNALLKTLEEPPAQVVFVLATTDPQKLPETIISRCQSFAFRRFSVNEIVSHLDSILSQEAVRRGIEVDDSDRHAVLELIARNAEGGMRDAQVTLDQVLVLCHEKLEVEAVRRFLGGVHSEVLDSFVRELKDRKTESLLVRIQELADSGQDLERFARAFAEYLRDLVISQSAPNRPELVNVSGDRHRDLKALGGLFSPAFLLTIAACFVALADEMRMSSQPRFLLELAVIRLTQVDPVDDIDRIVSRLSDLEKALLGGAAVATPARPSPSPSSAARVADESTSEDAATVPHAETMREPKLVTAAPPKPVERSAETHSYEAPAASPSRVKEQALPPPAATQPAPRADMTPEEFLAALREKIIPRNHYLHISLLEAAVISLSPGMLVLGVNQTDRFTYDHLNRAGNMQIVRDVAREILGREIMVRLEFANVKASGESGATPLVSSSEVPRQAGSAQPQPSPGTVVTAAAVTASHAAADTVPAADSAPQGPPRSVVLRGAALAELLAKRADVDEMFRKLKDVFHLDDAQIFYRMPTQ